MKKQKQQTEIVVPGVKKYGARKRNWDVEHHGKNIHVVSVKRPKMKDFEQWILLLADNHHDNPSVDAVFAVLPCHQHILLILRVVRPDDQFV